ncbi:MAG: zinc ribbon domain-containing protein [Gammaproteobacteria bacterium]
MKLSKKTDWDLLKLSDDDLAAIPLETLQRIRNKRSNHGMQELKDRADAELDRRDPRHNWSCLRCNKTKYHEKEMRATGGFMQSFLGWEMDKYHAIVCNYCGKTEFYSVLMSSSEKGIGFLGG